jgi:hypothetical protein
MRTGKLIYKKEDVLNFCSMSLSFDDLELTRELYRWKTDPVTREQMIEDFLIDSDKYFNLFKEYTKKLEGVVNRIHNL